jgi:hypothetical protein
MNNRIEELWQESMSLVTAEESGLPLDHYVTSRQKFAELIIQECIKVCTSRIGNSDYNTGRLHCVSDLKEHFGVKE